MSKKALVIGAGLGGLATALRLQQQGYEVQLLEKYTQAGGRLGQLKQDGFTFDLGPSFFSMSYEFTELFTTLGMGKPLNLIPLNPLYAVHFAGKAKPYLIHKELDKLALEFAGIEPNFQAKATRYLKAAKSIFHDTEYRIIKRSYKGKADYLAALATVPLKHAPKLLRTMWQELSRAFEAEEVKIIFSLVAFFLGATPFNTPAVYSLLNYTELEHDGYWSVEGGMYRITEVLVAALAQRGIPIHYSTEVVNYQEDEKGKLHAVVDAQGKSWFADLFVVNADAAAFRGQVMRRKAYSPARLDQLHWTLAPFTLYLGVRGRIPGMYHHNYFLGSNFKEYSIQLFRTSVAPQKPYYYVNVLSQTVPESAPEGCENLFVLCPVPDLRYKPSWQDAEQLADTLLTDLSTRVNYDLKANLLTRIIYTPKDWQAQLNLYQGSGLGLAHGLNQVGGMRPNNKDEQFNNLYYVGASTVPGTGLPMVIISSKLVAQRIQQEHGTA